MLWNGYLLLKNLIHLLHKGKLLARLEWIDASQHLIEHQTKTVPVHRVAIVLVLDDLGSQVLGCTTEGLCPVIVLLET